jgi:hypothetical protein
LAVARMTVLGAERKHVTSLADFRSLPYNGHSMLGIRIGEHHDP